MWNFVVKIKQHLLILVKQLGSEGMFHTYRNKNTQLNEAIKRGFCKVNLKKRQLLKKLFLFARTAKGLKHKISATIQKKILGGN